jgi:hypothetical protein
MPSNPVNPTTKQEHVDKTLFNLSKSVLTLIILITQEKRILCPEERRTNTKTELIKPNPFYPSFTRTEPLHETYAAPPKTPLNYSRPQTKLKTYEPHKPSTS